MIHHFPSALVVSLLVVGPGAAQTVAVSNAPPQYSAGLIGELSSRPGAISKVENSLSRITTNVGISNRDDGILARLDAIAGPEGWPAGAYAPEILADIGLWTQTLLNSVPVTAAADLSDFGPEWHPDLSTYEASQSEVAANPVFPDSPFFVEELHTPIFTVQEFREAFPPVQISAGFFGSF